MMRVLLVVLVLVCGPVFGQWPTQDGEWSGTYKAKISGGKLTLEFDGLPEPPPPVEEFTTVDDSSATDGVITFAVDESEVVEIVVPLKWPIKLQHTDIVCGSVEIIGDDGQVISDREMHGHHWNSKTILPVIDYKTGTIANPFKLQFFNTLPLTVRYRYCTTPTRKVRIVKDNMISLAWTNAPKAETGQSADSQICWAINAAKKLYLQTGQVAVVQIPGDYIYRGTIVIPDGVFLVGTGPEKSVPVSKVGWKVRGSLKCASDAFYYLHKDYVQWSTVHDKLQRCPSTIVFESRPPVKDASGEYLRNSAHDGKTSGLRFLEVDGNITQSDAIFTTGDYLATSYNNGYFKKTDPEQVRYVIFQNATHHCGIWHSELSDPFQSHVLENVYVHDFAANGIGGGGDWSGSVNVCVGDVVRNHAIYTMCGTVKNLTLYGYAWEALATMYHADYSGVNVVDITKNPYGYAYRCILECRTSADRKASIVLGQFCNIQCDHADIRELTSVGCQFSLARAGTVKIDVNEILNPAIDTFVLTSVAGRADVTFSAKSVIEAEAGQFHIPITDGNLTINELNVTGVEDAKIRYSLIQVRKDSGQIITLRNINHHRPGALLGGYLAGGVRNQVITIENVVLGGVPVAP